MAKIPTKPLDEQSEFVVEFLELSSDDREPFVDIWHETETNFFVLPDADQPASSLTKYPLASTLSDLGSRFPSGMSTLKDPETHQEVMTMVASQAGLLFPARGAFIGARGIGFEDIFKGTVTRDLIQHVHRLPGHFEQFILWLMAMDCYGTGILEGNWVYREEPRTFREVGVNPLTGEEEASDQVFVVPVYDDPQLEFVDNRDFFPDPSGTSMHNMPAAARRFRISAADAMGMVESGRWNEKAVREAIELKNSHDRLEQQEKEDDERLGTHEKERHPEFNELVGYRYIGDTPFKGEDGFTRREIISLGGRTARSEVWPRALPWFDGRVMPRWGSFWGIGPAEVIRSDQDFADTLKRMLADAVVRMTHPPMIYDKNAEVELAKLRRFNPRIPIGANRADAVQQVNYNPPVGDAFGMYSAAKQQMREASGALGAVQGLGLGSKRFSASEAVQTFQQAFNRPELFARVIEQEYLPRIGRYILDLYREFTEPGTDDIARRVGESDITPVLADILPEFDIEYVGSRTQTPEQEAAAFREVNAAAASNPILQQILPWVPLYKEYFRRIGADEIAAQIGDPQLIQLNTLLMLAGNQQFGNGNGETPSQPPQGALPAQIAGGVIDVG